VDAALREFINALSKSAMYPPGHRFIAESAAALAERLGAAMQDRDSLTIGVTPRGLLLDGTAIEPLPAVFRDFAVRMHRRNIGTMQIAHGVGPAEISAMLGALGAPDADETVGRSGLRLQHIRIEPLTYEVLGFADGAGEQDLDDIFWVSLVEAAFGRRLSDLEGTPTSTQIAEAISERAAQGAEGARRVYEALAAFSSALASRGDRVSGSARRRFVDILSALSRPTTTRVVAAAPSSASRRRFVKETLELVPPALLLQVLESVAEADGEPISPQLRWLLGKLAGGEAGDLPATGAFATEVVGLVAQWDGVASDDDEETDPRMGIEPARVLAVGLELTLASELVVDAGHALAERGQLLEALQLLDHPQNDPATVRTVADAVLDPGLLERLLKAQPVDFNLVERVARQTGPAGVGQLLDALSAAAERTTRRRLLDILVRIGPAAERVLVERLSGAPWYLARNILAVLAQFPVLENLDPVFAAFGQDELRVRQEALRVLIRQPAGRDRALTEALESGEESLVRLALGAIGSECPPRLVAPVLSVLAIPNEELRLAAIRALSQSNNPLVVPQLLALVRARRGFLRRQRLLPRSPVMLAALEVLAARWHNHRPAVGVLQLATRSPDAAVRAGIGIHA
jgi:hypothetical protein